MSEKNKFATHFVQKCLETRENEQNMVLSESSEVLGNRSDFGTCHDNSLRWRERKRFCSKDVVRQHSN